MPLSPPKARQHLHTREIDLKGYYRDDGLWDIEAHITDKKTYTYENQSRGLVASGHPVHDMSLRLSIDPKLVVREVEAVMDVQPYTICSNIVGNFQKLVGLKIGAGWNKRVREVVGSVEGCTHLAELLGPIATVAFQTLSGDHAQKLMGRDPGKKDTENADRTPFMLNGCHTWSANSPVVKQLYPAFYTGGDAAENDIKAGTAEIANLVDENNTTHSK